VKSYFEIGLVIVTVTAKTRSQLSAKNCSIPRKISTLQSLRKSRSQISTVCSACTHNIALPAGLRHRFLDSIAKIIFTRTTISV